MGVLPELGATAERARSWLADLARLLSYRGHAAPVWTPPTRQAYGPGTGRAAYVVVQRRRAANRVARRSRRINRRTR